MQGSELSECINKINSLRLFFKGVFSINTMPKTLQRREFYFTNIDLNHGDGSHWICILKNDNNEIELFDSLGLTPTKLEWFLKYLFIKSKKALVYNISSVQSPFSNTCGKFVLFFIIKRLHNMDMSFSKLLNEIFDVNTDENEIIVRSFLQDYM